MKKTFHLCWSGGNELLFRSREDYVHGILCLCIAAHKTSTRILAYCLMSNHVHLCIRTEYKAAFIKAFRYPYSRYFNSKYRRRGRLGERQFFSLEVEGLFHTLTAIAYILRNPLHHGVCSSPLGYEYSSVRAAFRKELGYSFSSNASGYKITHKDIPDRNKIPDLIKASSGRMVRPENIIDTTDLEHMFSTARSYLYYMNRLSGESWEKEQQNDNNGHRPISLEMLEVGAYGTPLRQMLANESGRSNYRSITDIDLCEEIDKRLIMRHGVSTIYELSEHRAAQLAAFLKRTYRASDEQIARCLAIK